MLRATHRSIGLFVSLAIVSPALASDWTNSGGNAGRNGQSGEIGPDSAALLWSGGRPGLVAFTPATEGPRVFMVRNGGGPTPTDSPIVCQDIDTGAELWFANLPFVTGEHGAWLAGVSNGRVYASRSGNTLPQQTFAKLHCRDAASGAFLWASVDAIDAGAYDGTVFAPNGDPIIGTKLHVWRINHLDGTTVWHVTRSGSSLGQCGAAVHGNGVFIADVQGAGIVIRKLDLATGGSLYVSPVMPGTDAQNTPMVGPDGTVYFSRIDYNPTGTDSFYAFTDTGSALTLKWNVPAGDTSWSEFAIGPDGTVYHAAPNDEIHRLDPATGATLATTGTFPASFSSPHIAVDALGRVYVGNGAFANGAVFAFEADLTPRFSIAVTNLNIGGPVIGANGTLIVNGNGTDVRAYRTSHSGTPFCFGDGSGTSCPCGNSSAVGSESGCRSLGLGGLLVPSGTPSIAADSLVLAGSQMTNSSALYFQGTAQTAAGAGTAFGDGLRCASGTVIRLGTKQNVAGSSAYPAPGDALVSVKGANPAGAVRDYQVWYRNAAPFCTTSTFNLTNGVEVTWAP